MEVDSLEVFRSLGTVYSETASSVAACRRGGRGSALGRGLQSVVALTASWSDAYTQRRVATGFVCAGGSCARTGRHDLDPSAGQLASSARGLPCAGTGRTWQPD